MVMVHHANSAYPQPRGNGDVRAAEVETMLEVMAAIENDGMTTERMNAAVTEADRGRQKRISMRFEMPGEK